MAGRTPAQQARQDAEKSKAQPVKSFKDMTPEERQAVIDQVNSVDRSRAKSRAEAAKRGRH